jgi:HEPN domain-containing protein
MKPNDGAKRKICGEWLHKADADMALAEHLMPDAARFANAVAFHSQQAAEKYLKALLTWVEVEFPKTHDLDQLLDLVQSVDTPLAGRLRDVTVLTPYGVELRYPGDRPDAGAEDAREAVGLARAVREAVLAALPPGAQEFRRSP